LENLKVDGFAKLTLIISRIVEHERMFSNYLGKVLPNTASPPTPTAGGWGSWGGGDRIFGKKKSKSFENRCLCSQICEMNKRQCFNNAKNQRFPTFSKSHDLGRDVRPKPWLQKCSLWPSLRNVRKCGACIILLKKIPESTWPRPF
jgi:hypothetical protein